MRTENREFEAYLCGFTQAGASKFVAQSLNAHAVRSYVRYIADWRLTQLMLTPSFEDFEETESGYRALKPHPLPWLVEIPNCVEHANFFEQRTTEYSKMRPVEVWDRDGRVWEMFEKRAVA